MDVRLLESYGLPADRQDGRYGFAASYQASVEPLLEGGLFEIGVYGNAKIGLSSADGSVWIVSPYSSADYHPQVRPLRSDSGRAVMINSSLVSFLGFAWRWHWLVSLLAEQQERAGEEEIRAWSAAKSDEERAALGDFYDDVRSMCLEVLDWLAVSDPVAPTGDGSFWREVILEYLQRTAG